MECDSTLDRPNVTSSVDLEAVQSLLAMSQWSPPSPPHSETRIKGEDYSAAVKGWTPSNSKDLKIFDDEVPENSRELNPQESVKVRDYLLPVFDYLTFLS